MSFLTFGISKSCFCRFNLGAYFINMLRDLFTTFGISEELTSDGGPEYTSNEVQKFLARYGVQHRKSSVGNPHANQRAEVWGPWAPGGPNLVPPL